MNAAKLGATYSPSLLCFTQALLLAVTLKVFWSWVAQADCFCVAICLIGTLSNGKSKLLQITIVLLNRYILGVVDSLKGLFYH